MEKIQWANTLWKCSACAKEEMPPFPCSGVIIGPKGWNFGYAGTEFVVACSFSCKWELERRQLKGEGI